MTSLIGYYQESFSVKSANEITRKWEKINTSWLASIKHTKAERNIFYYVIKHNDALVLTYLLAKISADALPKVLDGKQQNLLHHIARFGAMHCWRVLTVHIADKAILGALAKQTDKKGHSPLHKAAMGGYLALLKQIAHSCHVQRALFVNCDHAALSPLMRYRRFHVDNQCDDELCQYFPQAISAERYPMASEHQLARALFQYPTLFNGMGLPYGGSIYQFYDNIEPPYRAGVLMSPDDKLIIVFADAVSMNLMHFEQHYQQHISVQALDKLRLLWMHIKERYIKDKKRDITVLGFGLGGLDAQLFIVHGLLSDKDQNNNITYTLKTYHAPGLNGKRKNTSIKLIVEHHIVNGDLFSLCGHHLSGTLKYYHHTSFYSKLTKVLQKAKDIKSQTRNAYILQLHACLQAIVHELHWQSPDTTQYNKRSRLRLAAEHFQLITRYRKASMSLTASGLLLSETSLITNSDAVKARSERYRKVFSNVPEKHQCFVAYEWLFHSLVAKLRSRQYAPVLNNKGQLQQHGVISLLQNDGAYIYLLIPEEQLAIPSKTKGHVAYVLCQGTDIFDIRTVKADLAQKGPGAKVVHRWQNTFLKKINDAIKEHMIEHLVVGGHSLGGALAAQWVVKILEMVVLTKNAYPHFSTLKKLDAVLFNPAGISKSTADLSVDLAIRLHEWRKAKKSHLELGAYFQWVGGDPVQGTGESSLYYTVPQAEVVTMQMMYFNAYGNSLCARHMDCQWVSKVNEDESTKKKEVTQRERELLTNLPGSLSAEKMKRLLVEKWEPSKNPLFNYIKEAMEKTVGLMLPMHSQATDDSSLPRPRAVSAAKPHSTTVPHATPAIASCFQTTSDISLYDAAKRGDINHIKKIIGDKKSEMVLDSRENNKGKTALESAAYYGHIHIVSYLVSQGALLDVPLLGEDNEQSCPRVLRFALSQGHTAVVLFLIECGILAETGACERDDFPIHQVLRNTCLSDEDKKQFLHVLLTERTIYEQQQLLYSKNGEGECALALAQRLSEKEKSIGKPLVAWLTMMVFSSAVSAETQTKVLLPVDATLPVSQAASSKEHDSSKTWEERLISEVPYYRLHYPHIIQAAAYHQVNISTMLPSFMVDDDNEVMREEVNRENALSGAISPKAETDYATILGTGLKKLCQAGDMMSVSKTDSAAKQRYIFRCLYEAADQLSQGKCQGFLSLLTIHPDIARLKEHWGCFTQLANNIMTMVAKPLSDGSASNSQAVFKQIGHVLIMIKKLLPDSEQATFQEKFDQGMALCQVLQDHRDFSSWLLHLASAFEQKESIISRWENANCYATLLRYLHFLTQSSDSAMPFDSVLNDLCDIFKAHTGSGVSTILDFIDGFYTTLQVAKQINVSSDALMPFLTACCMLSGTDQQPNEKAIQAIIQELALDQAQWDRCDPFTRMAAVWSHLSLQTQLFGDNKVVIEKRFLIAAKLADALLILRQEALGFRRVLPLFRVFQLIGTLYDNKLIKSIAYCVELGCSVATIALSPNLSKQPIAYVGAILDGLTMMAENEQSETMTFLLESSYLLTQVPWDSYPLGKVDSKARRVLHRKLLQHGRERGSFAQVITVISGLTLMNMAMAAKNSAEENTIIWDSFQEPHIYRSFITGLITDVGLLAELEPLLWLGVLGHTVINLVEKSAELKMSLEFTHYLKALQQSLDDVFEEIKEASEPCANVFQNRLTVLGGCLKTAAFAETIVNVCKKSYQLKDMAPDFFSRNTAVTDTIIDQGTPFVSHYALKQLNKENVLSTLKAYDGYKGFVKNLTALAHSSQTAVSKLDMFTAVSSGTGMVLSSINIVLSSVILHETQQMRKEVKEAVCLLKTMQTDINAMKYIVDNIVRQINDGFHGMTRYIDDAVDTIVNTVDKASNLNNDRCMAERIKLLKGIYNTVKSYERQKKFNKRDIETIQKYYNKIVHKDLRVGLFTIENGLLFPDTAPDKSLFACHMYYCSGYIVKYLRETLHIAIGPNEEELPNIAGWMMLVGSLLPLLRIAKVDERVKGERIRASDLQEVIAQGIKLLSFIQAIYNTAPQWGERLLTRLQCLESPTFTVDRKMFNQLNELIGLSVSIPEILDRKALHNTAWLITFFQQLTPTQLMLNGLSIPFRSRTTDDLINTLQALITQASLLFPEEHFASQTQMLPYHWRYKMLELSKNNNEQEQINMLAENDPVDVTPMEEKSFSQQFEVGDEYHDIHLYSCSENGLALFRMMEESDAETLREAMSVANKKIQEDGQIAEKAFIDTYLKNDIICCVDSFGRTLLHYAVRDNHMHIVDVLLKQDKCFVNHADADGHTALHFSVFRNTSVSMASRLDMLEKLINAGARRDVCNKRGLTPYDTALANQQQENIIKFLQYRNMPFIDRLITQGFEEGDYGAHKVLFDVRERYACDKAKKDSTDFLEQLRGKSSQLKKTINALSNVSTNESPVSVRQKVRHHYHQLAEKIPSSEASLCTDESKQIAIRNSLQWVHNMCWGQINTYINQDIDTVDLPVMTRLVCDLLRMKVADKKVVLRSQVTGLLIHRYQLEIDRKNLKASYENVCEKISRHIPDATWQFYAVVSLFEEASDIIVNSSEIFQFIYDHQDMFSYDAKVTPFYLKVFLGEERQQANYQQINRALAHISTDKEPVALLQMGLGKTSFYALVSEVTPALLKVFHFMVEGLPFVDEKNLLCGSPRDIANALSDKMTVELVGIQRTISDTEGYRKLANQVVKCSRQIMCDPLKQRYVEDFCGWRNISCQQIDRVVLAKSLLTWEGSWASLAYRHFTDFVTKKDTMPLSYMAKAMQQLGNVLCALVTDGFYHNDHSWGEIADAFQLTPLFQQIVKKLIVVFQSDMELRDEEISALSMLTKTLMRPFHNALKQGLSQWSIKGNFAFRACLAGFVMDDHGELKAVCDKSLRTLSLSFRKIRKLRSYLLVLYNRLDQAENMQETIFLTNHLSMPLTWSDFVVWCPIPLQLEMKEHLLEKNSYYKDIIKALSNSGKVYLTQRVTITFSVGEELAGMLLTGKEALFEIDAEDMVTDCLKETDTQLLVLLRQEEDIWDALLKGFLSGFRYVKGLAEQDMVSDANDRVPSVSMRQSNASDIQLRTAKLSLLCKQLRSQLLLKELNNQLHIASRKAMQQVGHQDHTQHDKGVVNPFGDFVDTLSGDTRLIRQIIYSGKRIELSSINDRANYWGVTATMLNDYVTDPVAYWLTNQHNRDNASRVVCVYVLGQCLRLFVRAFWNKILKRNWVLWEHTGVSLCDLSDTHYRHEVIALIMSIRKTQRAYCPAAFMDVLVKMEQLAQNKQCCNPTLRERLNQLLNQPQLNIKFGMTVPLMHVVRDCLVQQLKDKALREKRFSSGLSQYALKVTQPSQSQRVWQQRKKQKQAEEIAQDRGEKTAIEENEEFISQVQEELVKSDTQVAAKGAQRAGEAVGRADEAVGQADEAVGWAGEAVGQADEAVGRADESLGQAKIQKELVQVKAMNKQSVKSGRYQRKGALFSEHSNTAESNNTYQRGDPLNPTLANSITNFSLFNLRAGYYGCFFNAHVIATTDYLPASFTQRQQACEQLQEAVRRARLTYDYIWRDYGQKTAVDYLNNRSSYKALEKFRKYIERTNHDIRAHGANRIGFF